MRRHREWVEAHLAPLAKRWGHIAPLLWQADAGARRGAGPPRSSVAETLDELAEREAAASESMPD